MIRMGLIVAGCACLAGCGQSKPAPPLPSEVLDFRTLYNENCSGCHSADGREGPAQVLNDPLYLRLIPRDQLQQTVENGRQGTSMPAFAQAHGGPLAPAQITAVVNGIEQNWAKPVDLGGATLPPYNAPPGDAQQGQAVFQAICSKCHGPKGRIGPLTDPSFLALVSDQSLRTTVIVGFPSFGMPDWRHQETPGGLSESDIANVVAWLASKRPQGRRPGLATTTSAVQGDQGSGPGASNSNTTKEERQ